MDRKNALFIGSRFNIVKTCNRTEVFLFENNRRVQKIYIENDDWLHDKIWSKDYCGVYKYSLWWVVVVVVVG